MPETDAASRGEGTVKMNMKWFEMVFFFIISSDLLLFFVVYWKHKMITFRNFLLLKSFSRL
jgi:hypothetical protein